MNGYVRKRQHSEADPADWAAVEHRHGEAVRSPAHRKPARAVESGTSYVGSEIGCRRDSRDRAARVGGRVAGIGGRELVRV